jgi:cell division protein FtsQ
MVDVDPRIEARRVEVRREIGRRRLRVLVLVAVVVVLLVGTYLAVESPFLDVDRVDVRGTEHLDPQRVRAAAGIEHGRALLRVDTAAVARRVETLPWVADATVTRDLPGTLRVTVKETPAVAFVRAPGRIAVLGPDGTVVASTREPPAGAVEVTGVRRVPERDELLSPVGVTRAIRMVPDRLAPLLRRVDLRDGTVVLVLDRGEIRLGALEAVRAKYAAALAVMDAEYATGAFEYIDVSVPSAPVSRP